MCYILSKSCRYHFGYLRPSDLPNRARMFISTVMEADMALWLAVAQQTRERVLTSGSPLPIDAALES